MLCDVLCDVRCVVSNVDVIFIIGSSPLSVCCLHIRLLAWPGPGWDDTKISPSPDIDCILMSKREERGGEGGT